MSYLAPDRSGLRIGPRGDARPDEGRRRRAEGLSGPSGRRWRCWSRRSSGGAASAGGPSPTWPEGPGAVVDRGRPGGRPPGPSRPHRAMARGGAAPKGAGGLSGSGPRRTARGPRRRQRPARRPLRRRPAAPRAADEPAAGCTLPADFRARDRPPTSRSAGISSAIGPRPTPTTAGTSPSGSATSATSPSSAPTPSS